MNTTTFISRVMLPLLAAFCCTFALAGPGAHGPNGEHVDGAGHSHAVSSDAPRMEASTETFELVATLSADELSILVDRFSTNEPVLGAQIEVESGALKAMAKFHTDHGDYAVADPAFLRELAKPGRHPLVLTITSGNESDLLEGVLTVTGLTATHDKHSHAQLPRWVWGVGVLATGALLAGACAWRVRRQMAKKGGAA
jgi:hypothetical protein